MCAVEIWCQFLGMNAFGIACVCAVREAADVVWSQSLLFCDFVVFEFLEELFGFFIGGEAVLQIESDHCFTELEYGY